MTTIKYRQATPEDSANCIAIRTRENAFSEEQLKQLGITTETWAEGVSRGQFHGYVYLIDNEIIGYCFADSDSAEIIVLALLPDYEEQGIGKTLLQMVVEDFKARGFNKLLLSCSKNPHTRSYGFYRHLGWTSTGNLDALGDEILELNLQEKINR